MRNPTSSILLVILSFIILSSCTKTDTIQFTGEKKTNALEIGFGVSIVPPFDFKRAKSYDGFQAPNQGGSIELTVESDFDQLKAKYATKTIKSKKGKLYRSQPVVYGENENAFYVEYYDKPQRRYRQALVISQGDKVYHLKAFHRGEPDHPYSSRIRKSLLTTHIGEFSKKVKPYSEAIILDFETIVYTRDNKYPTEEPDSMMVTLDNIDHEKLDGLDTQIFLEDKIRLICDGEPNSTREDLVNGYLLRCIARTDTESAIGLLLVGEKEKSILIQCVGNEKADLKEVGNYMLSQFLAM